MKRRMLRRAVQENVDLIHGVFRPSRRLSWRRVGRGVALAGLPLTVFATYLLANGGALKLGPEAAPDPATGIATGGPLGPEALPLFAAGPRSGASALPREAPKPLAPGVFPLAVRTVVVDPGHGGVSRGTEGPHGLEEKELTLDISERLGRLLRERSFQVEMTRHRDETVSLEDRARFANERRGDIFVSIHLNWLENREMRGVETFFLGPTDDPYVNRLAAKENLDSGYSLADFRRLLERVYVHARQGESRRLASAVHRSLYDSLRQISPDLRDRGVKRAPFAVLTRTEMPAILAEVSCLSNEEEARLLKLDQYRQYIALALARGIVDYADRVRGAAERGS